MHKESKIDNGTRLEDASIPSFDDLQAVFDDQSRHIEVILSQSRQQKPRKPVFVPHHFWRWAAAVVAVAGVSLVATISTTKHHYAYSENASGIRVYCENNCNADDVLQQMQEALLMLD